MGIDKVCDEARVFVDLLSAYAECVQLVKQSPPRGINVLCLFMVECSLSKGSIVGEHW